MFDAKKKVERIIEFIKDYYKKNNLKGAIIGISGGKDSGVVAGLFTKALGKENVIGVTLPCHSRKSDRNDALEVSKKFGFKLYNFDLSEVFDSFKGQVKEMIEVSEGKLVNSDINLKPRLRMATLYYFAAMFSAINKGEYLVAGTSNKCELYVGYFTKGGDSVQDISVLADFTVDEVIKIGEIIGVPSQVLYKVPDDGLSSLSDEEKLGVKYREIADYMEGVSIDETSAKIIKNLHEKNQHKFKTPTYRR